MTATAGPPAGGEGRAARRGARAAVRALAHRNFRHFWCCAFVSLIGTWVQNVALSWLVLELTSSASRLGMIGALQFGPMLVFSVFAGAVADRFSKRQLMVLTRITLMLAAWTLFLLVWTDTVQYWHITVLAPVIGLANTLDMPARVSFITELVGKDDLVNGVALNSAAINAARVIGPALGGFFIARYGMALAFLVNALTFVPVIVALLGIPERRPARHRRGEVSLLRHVAEGIRYAATTREIARLLSVELVVCLFVFNFAILVPLLARDVLGHGTEGLGLLMAALAVGAVVGAGALAPVGAGGIPVWVISTSAAVACGVTVTLALVRNFAAALALLFVFGFASLVFTTSCNASLQTLAPDEFRGRVMGLHTLAFLGVFPVGALLTGTLAQWLGVPATFAIAGGLGLSGLLVLQIIWSRGAGAGPAVAVASSTRP